MRMVALAEIAAITAGQSPPGSTYNEDGLGLPFFQGKADFGEIHPTVRKWCTAPKKIAEAGEILISVRAPVGPTNIAEERCCIGRGLAAIRPDDKVALPEFVHWALKRGETQLAAKATGTTFGAIGQKELKSIIVPLPPLDEQRRIVDILNRTARIETLRKLAGERLREFVPALFVRMFGDPVTNPMKWQSEKLSSLGTLDRGRSRHRPRNAAHLYGGPYPFVQTGDIANCGGLVTRYSQTYSDAGLDQSRMWPSGTLCITIAANIAMTGILTFDSCFPDSVVGFRPGKAVTVEYVQTIIDLMQKRLEEGAPRAAQRNINLGVLRNLTVPTPPVNLQRRFSDIVDVARAYAHVGEASTSTARRLTKSLSTEFLQDSVSERGTNHG